LLNNYWTFRHRKTKDRTRIRGLKFNLVSILALGVSYATFVALSLAFPETAAQIHQLIGIIPATIINYLLNSYWTFGYAHNGKHPGRDRQRGTQEMQGNGDRLGRHVIGADTLSAARQKRH